VRAISAWLGSIATVTIDLAGSQAKKGKSVLCALVERGEEHLEVLCVEAEDVLLGRLVDLRESSHSVGHDLCLFVDGCAIDRLVD
jgi:hypothetical protein